MPVPPLCQLFPLLVTIPGSERISPPSLWCSPTAAQDPAVGGRFRGFMMGKAVCQHGWHCEYGSHAQLVSARQIITGRLGVAFPLASKPHM